MASYVDYKPLSIIGQALFNFSQGLGTLEHRYKGSIKISVSDPFTFTQSRNLSVSDYVYTQLPLAIRPWTASQIEDVNAIATGFSQIASLSFEPTVSYSRSNPAEIGTSSDINISLIHRSNLGTIAGASGLFTDFDDAESFKYVGAAGDIVINATNLGDRTGTTVLSFGSTGYAGFTLLHEIGHSLGMAHPHISELANGTRVLSSNFSQTAFVGFQDLGFTLNRIADMDKSYFTIMSYHQTKTSGGQAYFAQNPMILDVIALQEAYGVGVGTTGASNDTISPGTQGIVNSHRTYFDTGGNDTIDLQNYASGAYLHMGTTIVGASYPVGISVSTSDAARMATGSDLESVRWYYGDFENAVGGTAADRIVGNSSNNIIRGNGGNDSIDGGSGIDTAIYSGIRSNYTLTKRVSSYTVTDKTGSDGTDTLTNIERLVFSDFKEALGITALIESEVQKLYIAYFNRPGDPGGLGYWEGLFANGASMTMLQNSFSSSAEYQAIYIGQQNTVLITKLYQNLFGRVVDVNDVGVQWWAGEMAAGRHTITTIAGALSSGTTPGSADNIAIINKIEAATAFTNALNTNAETENYVGTAAFAIASNWLAPIRDDNILATSLASRDATIASAVAAKTVLVNATGTANASQGVVTFELAAASFDYTISGFGVGDRIDFPTGAVPTLTNASYSDGQVNLIWSAGGNNVLIKLVGLSVTQDSQLNTLADFDTVFGSGSVY